MSQPEVGLEGLVPYERALAAVLEAAASLSGTLGCEDVPVEEASGRVLAEDVVASQPWPLDARATMDGYAVRANDLRGASEQDPVRLRVTATLVAGSPPAPAVGRGCCVRIMTGAPLPEGADAVLPQELAAPDGDGWILAGRTLEPGTCTFAPGEDVRAGETVLRKGTPLTGGAVAMLAALGRTTARVASCPVFSVVTTGDEVVDAGTPALQGGQVRDSNARMLGALLRAWGGRPRLDGIARDDEESIEAAARRALDGTDGLIVTGGMSVGTRDLVRPVLERLGVRWLFHRVAIRPGRPAGFGLLGRRPVFGLPGTPGGAMVAAELFVRPLVARWLGREWIAPEMQATALERITSTPGRMRWLRGRASSGPGGRPVVAVLGRQSSSSVRSLAEANVLVVLPPEVEVVPAGSPVRIRVLAENDWSW